ncbi:hypothetical protein ACJX0J_028019, partial [Zea mays]
YYLWCDIDPKTWAVSAAPPRAYCIVVLAVAVANRKKSELIQVIKIGAQTKSLDLYEF